MFWKKQCPAPTLLARALTFVRQVRKFGFSGCQGEDCLASSYTIFGSKSVLPPFVAWQSCLRTLRWIYQRVRAESVRFFAEILHTRAKIGCSFSNNRLKLFEPFSILPSNIHSNIHLLPEPIEKGLACVNGQCSGKHSDRRPVPGSRIETSGSAPGGAAHANHTCESHA